MTPTPHKSTCSLNATSKFIFLNSSRSSWRSITAGQSDIIPLNVNYPTLTHGSKRVFEVDSLNEPQPCVCQHVLISPFQIVHKSRAYWKKFRWCNASRIYKLTDSSHRYQFRLSFVFETVDGHVLENKQSLKLYENSTKFE